MDDLGPLPVRMVKTMPIKYPKNIKSFVLHVHFPGENISKSLFSTPNELPADIMIQICRKAKHVEKADPSDFIFKIGGYDEYIDQNASIKLGDICYVQQTLLRKMRIHFTMVKRSSLLLTDKVRAKKLFQNNITPNLKDILNLKKSYYPDPPLTIGNYFSEKECFSVIVSQVLELENSQFGKLEFQATHVFAQVFIPNENLIEITPLTNNYYRSVFFMEEH